MLRPRFRLIGLLLGLCCSLPFLFAQRPLGRFDAAQIGEGLNFDTNEIPLSQGGTNDLNFAPNVVFTADSSRAFISFPATDKVAVFDGRSGELIQLLETCKNPTELVMSSDGRRLVVPCIFLIENLPQGDTFAGARVGAVSIIDVETLQVRVIDLQEVVFSFLNNIVLTPDGSRGFIASSGTDQVIQLDIPAAREVGRLGFETGTRPSRITMSHDGSFFGVVLVGSGALPQTEVPDSVRIVDSQSFQVTKNLSFTVPAGQSPISYSALNRVAFSPDGKFALVAENGRPSASRALFIDVENEQLVDVVEDPELLDALQLGFGVATGAYATPDGESFVVLRDSSICTVTIQTQAFRCASIFPLGLFAMTNPAFTDNLMYVGAPLDDELLVFDWRTRSLVNSARLGGNVERIVEATTVTVPSGPVSITVSPDGTVIAATYFNANAVELFAPTFRSVAPALTGENVDQIQNTNPLKAPQPVPPGERFFTGVALTNYGEKETEVVLTPMGVFTDPAPIEDEFFLRARPNPMPVCDDGLGSTTLTWGVGDRASEVEIRADAVDGEVVGSGEDTGTLEVDDIPEGRVFFLLNRLTGALLDTLATSFTEVGCSAPAIFVSPNPARVCPGELGRTNILWNSSGVAQTVEVRVGSSDGEVVAAGSFQGSATTGDWVTEGLTFFLVDAQTQAVLDTTVAHLSEADCLLSVPDVLAPRQQISFGTELLQPEPGRNFRGWADVESDEPTLAGLFTNYDGAFNRLDAGPVTSENLALGVLPETRFSDGFSTEIEVVNPGPVLANVQFDLFDSEGQFVTATVRGVPARSRVTLPLLGDPSLVDEDDGLFVNAGVVDGFVLILADPDPITVCDGGSGQTTLFWDVTGLTDTVESVEVRVGSPDGELLTAGGATGSQETGQWVRNRMIFFLLDAATGDVLDSTSVRLTESGCPPPVIAVEPNPITVCQGDFGQATLLWDATDSAELVEVRVDSTQGPVVAAGGPTGRTVTGQWVTEGMTFHLVNQTTGAGLDSVTARLTGEGCLLSEFDDGYVRISGGGFVAFERVIDANRMAISPVQPMGQPYTHFTVPHFVAFGGTETVLKLVNPSTQPIGQLTDLGGGEDQDPMQVTVALRGDDGGSIDLPVTLELLDGASLRLPLGDLFNLTDTGQLQSGWIELTSSRSGLVGLAEIQVSDGQALSFVPLQPVRQGGMLFPYLAQGAGLVTSLAIVNPGESAVEITAELTRPDGQLAATLGPLTLAPGQRLSGTIPDLFPEVGEVLGGTLLVRADGDVTGVALFQTEDLRALSVVTAERIP